MWLMGFRKCVLIYDLLAVKFSAGELKAHPLGHVIDRGTHAAGRRFGIGVSLVFLHPLAVDLGEFLELRRGSPDLF
jgi:hypothetical protein